MRSVIAAYQMAIRRAVSQVTLCIKASQWISADIGSGTSNPPKQKNPLRTSLAHGYDLIPLHFYQARRPYAAGFLCRGGLPMFRRVSSTELMLPGD